MLNINKHTCTYMAEMPTSEDLKSGDCLFFTTRLPPREFQWTPTPPKNWLSPQPPVGMTYDIIWRLTWCTCYQNNAPETVPWIRKIQVLSWKLAKSQTKSVLFFTKYSIFIVDVKSGRFMYQRGRARDEAKKRKSSAKSWRVGITDMVTFVLYTCKCFYQF